MSGDDSAFPIPPDGTSTIATEGLTKRELFAAMAMAGYLASCPSDGSPAVGWLARDAVEYADALISELNKEQSQ